MDRKGFTLIELLIVIGVIAVLSVLVFLILNPTSIFTRGRTVVTRNNINDLGDIVFRIKSFSGKTLYEILRDRGVPDFACSDCGCRDSLPVTPSDNPDCISDLTAAWDAIEAEGRSLGLIQSLNELRRDSWGTLYLIDANEGEPGQGCQHDRLISVGPDKILTFGVVPPPHDDIYAHSSSSPFFIPDTSASCIGQ